MITTLVRRAASVAALACASLLFVPAVGAEAGTAPARASTSCATVYWGSLPKAAHAGYTTALTDVRAGRHACFDRLVVDLTGPSAAYDVRYVDTVHREGVGTAVATRGGAVIQIVVQAPSYDRAGRATYTPARPAELVPTTGYRAFRQVAWAGSYEGQSTIALGVRGRLPMRVFVLDGPGHGSRLVIDVAHRW